MKNERWFLILLIGAGLCFLKITYALGWLIGCMVMEVSLIVRRGFYKQLMCEKSFRVGSYVRYMLLIMSWLAGPLLVAFIKPGLLSPYLMFVAYFVYRIAAFIRPFLTIERTHVSN